MEISELSLFLAKAWGVFISVTCLALLINVRNMSRIIKSVLNEGWIVFSGFVSLIIGVLSVVAHNIWTTDFRLLITLFGWMALIKGVVRIAWPQNVVQFVKQSINHTGLMVVLLLVFMVLGVGLTYLGYSIDSALQMDTGYFGNSAGDYYMENN